ncbi:MAG: prolipoprotein diacylglyceryl transferase [Candidatus Krumholzibacteriota bacterium]|nr:prolipoprotein diacylglyceryl transferase [Candidatus Krumholzibacteriota bacterium]
MHPVLVELGPLKIYSYGFMLALSFLVGIWLAARRADRRGPGGDLIYDLSIILVLGAVIGSRGLYILTHRDNYHSILDIIALWQGGATYYGGLVLAVAGAVVFLWRKNISFMLIADICAPSIALGVFFTRIGCFLSGCCFGHPTSCPAGMVFPAGSPAGWMFPGIHIHPTQLYSSLYGIAIFALLLLVERWKRFDGFVFSFLCIFYGIARFVVDFFRWYEDSAMVGGGLTFNQVISIGLVAAGGILLAVLGRRKGRS